MLATFALNFGSLLMIVPITRNFIAKTFLPGGSSDVFFLQAAGGRLFFPASRACITRAAYLRLERTDHYPGSNGVPHRVRWAWVCRIPVHRYELVEKLPV